MKLRMWTKGFNEKRVMEIWTAVIVISLLFPLYVTHSLLGFTGIRKINETMYKINEKLYDIFFYFGEKIMFHAYYTRDYERERRSLISKMKGALK